MHQYYSGNAYWLLQGRTGHGHLSQEINGSSFHTKHWSVPIQGQCQSFVIAVQPLLSVVCFIASNLVPGHICCRSGPWAGGADGGGIPVTGHPARNGAAVPILVLQTGTASITKLPQFKEDGAEPILSKRESPQQGIYIN